MLATRRSCHALLFMTACLVSWALSPVLAHASDSSKRGLLFAKALSYERRLSATKGASVGILVLYAANDSTSKTAADRWPPAFAALEIQGVPIEVLVAPFEPESIRKLIRSRGIDVLIACDGVPQQAVSGFATAHEILSAADSPQGVANGLGFGVFVTEDKPRIVINMRVAKVEGARFSSKLLQIAEVI